MAVMYRRLHNTGVFVLHYLLMTSVDVFANTMLDLQSKYKSYEAQLCWKILCDFIIGVFI